MTAYQHTPHPRAAARASTPPPQTDDERVGFNGRLGAGITRAVGTMWAFYIAVIVMSMWMLLAEIGLLEFDTYPFAFLLFIGNVVQLLLMFVIMVGQQVLGRASDKRALQTYQDAEAILHECNELQKHLFTQDQEITELRERLAKVGG